LSNAAVTELSTPPLMATAAFFGVICFANPIQNETLA
jgi:hypothetical protein